MRVISCFISSILLLGILFSTPTLQAQKISKSEAQVQITITDGNKIPQRNTKIIFRQKGAAMKKSVTSDTAGKATIILPQGKTFSVAAHKYGKNFNFPKPLKIPEVDGPLKFRFDMSLVIDTVYKDKFTLKNVYFDLDKATLKEKSHSRLNKLVNKLKENPSMVIEIAGHTDNQGSKQYNLRLSQRRANTVRQYIINKGINSNRVKAKGYGEAQPIADNSTKKGRAKNRRTEVRIIKK